MKTGKEEKSRNRWGCLDIKFVSARRLEVWAFASSKKHGPNLGTIVHQNKFTN